MDYTHAIFNRVGKNTKKEGDLPLFKYVIEAVKYGPQYLMGENNERVITIELNKQTNELTVIDKTTPSEPSQIIATIDDNNITSVKDVTLFGESFKNTEETVKLAMRVINDNWAKILKEYKPIHEAKIAKCRPQNVVSFAMA